MTKIKLISDIHIDYDRTDPTGQRFLESLPKDDIDVLAFAGDLVTGGNLSKYLDAYKRMADSYPHVVAVLGNHDYYNSTIKETFDVMNDFQAKTTNFHWLQNNKKEINGQVFAGTTLWFPEIDWMPGFHSWIDFRYVKYLNHDYKNEHEAARQFIKNEVSGSDILITHHIPHHFAVHGNYVGDDYNCYFLGDCSDILDPKNLPYVFFGHSHLYIDRQIKNTQYLLNPRGYPGEWGKNDFNKDLIIDTSLDVLEKV